MQTKQSDWEEVIKIYKEHPEIAGLSKGYIYKKIEELLELKDKK